jgi:hypothetical protein
MLLSPSCSACSVPGAGLFLGQPAAGGPVRLGGGVAHVGPVLAGLVIPRNISPRWSAALSHGPHDRRGGAAPLDPDRFWLRIASGLVTVLADTVHAGPLALYAIVLAGRILLGINESLVSTSAMAWGVARAGWRIRRASSHGTGLPHLAPLVWARRWAWVFGHGGLAGIGWAECAVGLCGLAFAWPQGDVPPEAKARVPLRDVFATVMPMAASGAGHAGVWRHHVLCHAVVCRAWLGQMGGAQRLWRGFRAVARVLCGGFWCGAAAFRRASC